ncbi:MAG: bifunctional oligoribonuclease/PAP phosphatase NrnA [Candidatus Omnitrophota bacterium]|nr:bifunctional oligoribonuclease/PAP phosphatase NrnA [Candidatus Omnitrophota bacterium]
MGITQVVKTIKKYNSFLVTSHINPDGDAVGSQFALALLLRQAGKKVVIVDDEKIPSKYDFLGKWIPVDKLVRKPNFKVAIILDSSNLNRLGRVVSLLSPEKKIVNIDHHVSNENFGDVNWVDTGAGAVGEMIYRLYKKMNCRIENKSALSIYTAILTDTGSFRYTNTSSNTHRIASRLLECGVEPGFIAGRLYEVNSLASMKLLEMALSTIKIVKDGARIAWLCVTNDMLNRANADFEDTEDFVNYARSLQGVEIAIFFSETKVKNEIKVSLRSTGAVDVNLIAEKFGGGGHSRASGCRIKGSLGGVIKKVVSKVQGELKNGRNINR